MGGRIEKLRWVAWVSDTDECLYIASMRWYWLLVIHAACQMVWRHGWVHGCRLCGWVSIMGAFRDTIYRPQVHLLDTNETDCTILAFWTLWRRLRILLPFIFFPSLLFALPGLLLVRVGICIASRGFGIVDRPRNLDAFLRKSIFNLWKNR